MFNFADAHLANSSFVNQPFSSILSVTFSPDGKILATGDDNAEIRLWRASDGEQLLLCKGHTSRVWSVAFSPDSQILASGSEDQTIKLWDVKTGQCLKTLTNNVESKDTNRIWSVCL